MGRLGPYGLDTIVVGDCLDVMRQMPDGCVDLVVTSPPYDDLRQYDGYSFNFEPVAVGLYRILAGGGVVVWVVADQTKNGSETGTSFRQALGFMDSGFNLHDTMIYMKKDYPPLTHNRYEQRFEYMFVLSKGRPSTFNPLMVACKHAGESRNKSNTKQEAGSAIRGRTGYTTVKDKRIKGNVWIMAGAHTKIGHPAIFPMCLASDHIESWSASGDVIFDPFMGSGTTAVAAKKLGRHYFGCDISEEYVKMARERVAKIDGVQMPLSHIEMED